MSLIRRAGARISLIRRLRVLPAYMTDRSIGFHKKGGVLLGLFYVIWPLDAIPDVIPVLGWLDDLGVLSLLSFFMMRELGQYIERRRSDS